ncbi:MAG: DedA family protein [Caulobacteraceae bacterium]|nr:DedA family protein [Caulobacter sp.]
MFDLFTRWIAQGGWAAVFLLMLVENVVPVIPSELILPAAGFVTTQGRLGAAPAALAATAGSVLGALVWFELGRRLGPERLERWTARSGRWLGATPAEVRHGMYWFRRWGAWAVGVGRCLPGVRGIICLPAGVARMGAAPFLASCTAGSLAWCALLIEAGRLLQAHASRVHAWLNPATAAFALVCVAAYVWRVATFKPRREADA